jgi:hypothetical protein
MALGMWFAWSVAGAIALFVSICACFITWYRVGSRGAWVAAIVVGTIMTSVLTWQAATGARCPASGERVILKEGKPPVSCSEIRASAGAMAAFFGIVALIGVAAPFYARRLPEPDDVAGDERASTVD